MSDGAKILIVEEIESDLVFLQSTLVSLGFQVESSKNGREALEKVQKDPPDFILLNTTLPGIDGYYVAERLKSNENTMTIPVIMLYSRGQDIDRVKAHGAGADDILKKPVQVKELESRIKSLLKVKAYNDFLKNDQSVLKEELAGANSSELPSIHSLVSFPGSFSNVFTKRTLQKWSSGTMP